MDDEEKQEMLDVGVKKSGRDVPSSVGCVPWRLVWLHDIMMSSLENKCKILPSMV